MACFTVQKVTEILPDKPANLKLAFISTASNPYKDKSWLYKDRDKLIEMGFIVKDIDIAYKTHEYLQKELATVDVVFVSGGNTFYLLEKVRDSGFDKIIKKNNQ